MNERQRALVLLERIEQTQSFATPLLATETDLVRTYVLGVLRWRSQLDFLIEKLASRRAARIDPLVLQILRLGLCELRFMHSAPYATVDGVVELAKQRAARASGFVNAVLRSATRAVSLDDLLPTGGSAAAVALRYAHPEWIIERWTRRFGAERAAAIAASNQQLSFPDLLLNLSRFTEADAHALLSERGVSFKPSSLVRGMVRLGESTQKIAAEVREGLFYPMDEGSGVVAALMATTGGSSPVLDLAAAPGGKTLFFRNSGRTVVSHDLSLTRLLTARKAITRMFGGGDVLVVGDAGAAPFRRRFDAVLLDAPCSATGTFRKSPELKWRVTPELLDGMAALQERLLHGALDLSGNECLYATCSLEPEENSEVVARVLASRSDFRLASLEARAGDELAQWITAGQLQLTPEAGTDGFGASLLQRI